VVVAVIPGLELKQEGETAVKDCVQTGTQDGVV